MKCPACEGKQPKGIAHINRRDAPHTWEPSPACHLCDGKGEVSIYVAASYNLGRKMRDDRVARGLSLREEAERLGIKPIELNNRELGRGTVSTPLPPGTEDELLATTDGPGSPSKAESTDATPVQNKSALSDEAGGKE